MIRADGVDLLAGREVHHGIGPVLHGGEKFFQLAGGVAGERRLADVRVDLRPRGNADADRLEALLDMHFIGRYDHPPPGDFVANPLRIELLRLGDKPHFGRDHAGFGLFKLSHRK